VILISTDVTKLSSEDTIRDDIERRVDRYVLDGGGLVAGHDIIYHRTRNTLLTKAFGATIERFDDKEVDNKKIPIKYEKTSAATKDPIWRRLPDHFNLDDDELLVTSWTKGASILFTEEGVPERALVVARTHDKGRLVWLNSCDRGKSGLAKSIGDPSREFVNLLTASVQWVAKRRPPPIGAPLIGAHRGVAGSGGENTLAAFGEAIRQRADFIETDIRKTKDGILVLHHDEKIGFAYIAETSFSDLQSIASVRKRPLAKLEELLALAKDRIMLDLELKESGYEGEIVALLQKHQVDTDDFVVTSFLEEAIRQFKNAYKEATCGLLVGKRSWWREWFLLRRVERSGADFVAANDRLVRLWFARRMARHDHPVWVWTVNDPARIARLLRTTGVEAVITDIVTTAKTEQETARSS
jgi:glycerophosphoryl diester phosphodiesterase